MASSLGPTLVRCDPPALVVTGEVPTAPPLPRLDAAVPLPASEEVLRAVLPPRVHTADGKTWVSAAATTPATRGDVAALADALDARLRQQGARDFGVCPVREELYAQAFDEIIRQVTIGCSERGLLLARVRDEAKTTIAALDTQYESCVAFGIRKALLAEQRKSELRARVAAATEQLADLEASLVRMESQLRDATDAEAARDAADEALHNADVSKMRGALQALTRTLDDMLAPPAQSAVAAN